MQNDQKIKRGREHIEELFKDKRENLEHITSGPQEIVPEITKEKMLYALKTGRMKKNPEPDELPIAIYKLVDERIGILLENATITTLSRGCPIS